MNKYFSNNPNSLLNVKTVIKAKDMDDDMFKDIEKIARDTFDPKEKLKDEIVNNKYKYRKLRTILKIS